MFDADLFIRSAIVVLAVVATAVYVGFKFRESLALRARRVAMPPRHEVEFAAKIRDSNEVEFRFDRGALEERRALADQALVVRFLEDVAA